MVDAAMKTLTRRSGPPGGPPHGRPGPRRADASPWCWVWSRSSPHRGNSTPVARRPGGGEGLTRLNENGRFAVDLLASDLRMAGYLSCGGAGAEHRQHSRTVRAHWLYQTAGLRGFRGRRGHPAERAHRKGAHRDRRTHRAPRGRRVRGGRATPSAGRGPRDLEPGPATRRPCSNSRARSPTTRVATFAPASFVATTGSDPGNCTNKLFGSFDCTTPWGLRRHLRARLRPAAATRSTPTTSAPPTPPP